MISDVLFEAIQEIERYQTDPVFAHCYVDMREWIDRVKVRMERLRRYLDSPDPRDDSYDESVLDSEKLVANYEHILAIQHKRMLIVEGRNAELEATIELVKNENAAFHAKIHRLEAENTELKCLLFPDEAVA
jgi:hypothetical protein